MLLPLLGDSFVSVITQGVSWARSFCPLPLLYPSASDFQFPSAGDRWFRAFRCNLWMSLVLLQKLLYCYQQVLPGYQQLLLPPSSQSFHP